MSQLDVYYRAFKGYRKETLEDAECVRSRKAIKSADLENDKLEATKFLCDIKDDWVIAIEKGLVFVEKAVAEERQFIRTNGEVVPIEKVRKISKDSVVHLAKHSEMITHVPDENSASDVIPDKLYMVEKLSDYAVYENRFLYMMLTYLQNFIDFRLEKIEDLRRTYAGFYAIDKSVNTPKKKLSVRIELHDDRTDNLYPVVDEKSATLLQRIADCQRIVNALLNTDLMVQVAKTPMIKPPIVKTNVLKMNNNFKQALALYDFVATYEGLGFSYEEVKYDFAPFAEKTSDELAEVANLITFLAYKYGNDLDDVLETAYRKEEERRKEEEEQKQLARLRRLKKAASESGKSLEEYVLVLEERNRALEKNNEQRIAQKQEIENLRFNMDVLVREKNELLRREEDLESEIRAKETEIERLNVRYEEAMAQAERDKAQAVMEKENEITALYMGEADRVRAEWEEKTRQITEDCDGRIYEIEQEMEAQNDRTAAEIEKAQQSVLIAKEKLQDEKKAHASECAQLQTELDALRREHLNTRTELDGLRAKNGFLTPSNDYTSRERFLELEEEFEAFGKFFRGQWKVTKRAIRKEVLWGKQNAKNAPASAKDAPAAETKEDDAL